MALLLQQHRKVIVYLLGLLQARWRLLQRQVTLGRAIEAMTELMVLMVQTVLMALMVLHQPLYIGELRQRLYHLLVGATLQVIGTVLSHLGRCRFGSVQAVIQEMVGGYGNILE